MIDATRYSQDIDPSDDTAHSRALRAVGSAGRVLELGPGPGHMTELLHIAGNRVTCVEVDAAAAAEAGRFAERVVVADLDTADLRTLLAGAPFDAAVAADVLEHLRRPDRTLRQCAELVRPGGRVVLSIPNVAHVDVRLALLAGRWDYKEHGLLDLTHLRFFTRASALRLVESVGLEVREVQTVTWAPFTTNLGAAPSDVPADLLARLLADPDAQALQFVITATVPDSGLAPLDEATLLATALCSPGVYGEHAHAAVPSPAPSATAEAPHRTGVLRRLTHRARP